VTGPPPHTSRRFLVVVTLVGVGLGMTAPLTVLLAQSLGAGPVGAGLAVSSIAVSLLVVDLFGTTYVPRLPGRTLLWLSLAVFGIGSLGSAAAPSLGVMIAARVFQGFGAALFMSGALHVVLRAAPRSQAGSAIGAFNACWFSGMAVGPLLGGGLAQLLPGQSGFRLAFAVCAAVCGTVAVITRLALPALPSARIPRLSWPRAARARPGTRLWPPLSLAAIAQLVRGSLVPTVLPVLATDSLGLSVLAVGVALSVLSAVDVLTMRFAGRLADRRGRRGVLVPGLVLGALSCGVVPWVHGPVPFTLWCAALAISLGVTWVVPTAMVVDVARDTEAGIATYRIAADGAQLAGPVAAGSLIGATGPVGAVLALGAVLGVTGVAALRGTGGPVASPAGAVPRNATRPGPPAGPEPARPRPISTAPTERSFR